MTWRGSVAVALAASLAAASCGGSDAPEPQAAAEAPVAQGVYGSAPAAVGLVPSVVSLRPVGRVELPPAASVVPEHGKIDQFGLAFSPTAVLLRVGGTLRFENSEAALTHNVEVTLLDGDSTLLDDDVASGQSIEVALPAEGGYAVHCEYHPGMTAFVFATADPLGTIADRDGHFAVSAPPGEYLVRLWSADPALRSERTVRIGEGATELPDQPSG